MLSLRNIYVYIRTTNIIIYNIKTTIFHFPQILSHCEGSKRPLSEVDNLRIKLLAPCALQLSTWMDIHTQILIPVTLQEVPPIWYCPWYHFLWKFDFISVYLATRWIHAHMFTHEKGNHYPDPCFYVSSLYCIITDFFLVQFCFYRC